MPPLLTLRCDTNGTYNMKSSFRIPVAVLVVIMLGACSTPAIRQSGQAGTVPPTDNSTSSPQDSGIAPQVTAAPAEPLPSTSAKSFSLNAASTALVAQAHSQLAANNPMMAASTIERALRIEPNNPLLWLEYAQVRMSEQSFSQAENMGRKALMLANGDPKTQSSAWRAIAASLRAQNKIIEAQQADSKADTLTIN
jgi:tetratricopeptide (TPR) repeat protein